MPRQEQDDLTEAEAIPLAATGAARRRAERGSARLLERLQRHHPERHAMGAAVRLALYYRNADSAVICLADGGFGCGLRSVLPPQPLLPTYLPVAICEYAQTA
jgi:hypothetical protein